MTTITSVCNHDVKAFIDSSDDSIQSYIKSSFIDVSHSRDKVGNESTFIKAYGAARIHKSTRYIEETDTTRVTFKVYSENIRNCCVLVYYLPGNREAEDIEEL